MGESPDAGQHAAYRRWTHGQLRSSGRRIRGDDRVRAEHAADAGQGRPHQDLASYSRSNLVLANVGNAFYSLYVFHLPPGPIWLLHTFYAVTSALMLLWSLRFGRPNAKP